MSDEQLDGDSDATHHGKSCVADQSSTPAERKHAPALAIKVGGRDVCSLPVARDGTPSPREVRVAGEVGSDQCDRVGAAVHFGPEAVRRGERGSSSAKAMFGVGFDEVVGDRREVCVEELVELSDARAMGKVSVNGHGAAAFGGQVGILVAARLRWTPLRRRSARGRARSQPARQ